VDGDIFHIPGFGNSHNPFCKNIPYTFPPGNFFKEICCGNRIPVVDLFINLTRITGLHGKGHQISGRDGIHTQAIADIVEIGNFFNGADLTKPAEGIDGLIFRPFDGQPLVGA